MNPKREARDNARKLYWYRYSTDWTQADDNNLRRPALPLEVLSDDAPEIPGAPPASALQYLRMVRAEANACQQVVSVPIPREYDQAVQISEIVNDSLGRRTTGGADAQRFRPSAEWLDSFLDRFHELKDTFAAYRNNFLGRGRPKLYKPHAANEPMWKTFCYGPQSDETEHENEAIDQERDMMQPILDHPIQQDESGSPPQRDESGDTTETQGEEKITKRQRDTDTEDKDRSLKKAKKPKRNGPFELLQGPKEPVLSIVCALTHGEAMSLLEYHIDWLKDDITGQQAQWIFALFMRVDNLLTGEDISTIRDLCRKCQYIRSSLTCVDIADPRIASLTMIIAIISVIYDQRDLGDELTN